MRRADVVAVPCTTRPSERLLHACAIFGLHAVHARDASCPRPDVARIAHCVAPGRIVLLTGPSGAGKSCALRELIRELRRRGTSVHTSMCPKANRPIVDLLPGGVEHTLGTLARAGLAEPRLFARSPSELSDGQRFRFELASMFGRARTGAVIVVDEFCSTLDRVTARSVATLTATWVRREGRVGLVCATAHDDIAESLAPDCVARFNLHAELTLETLPGEDEHR